MSATNILRVIKNSLVGVWGRITPFSEVDRKIYENPGTPGELESLQDEITGN